jgi:cobalamin synthase
VLAWFAGGRAALLIAPIAIAAALAIGWLTSRRLGGGLTGDVYGFGIVVVEVAALVALSKL